MSGPEVKSAVEDYLRHTGGSEVDQLYIGLGKQASKAQIRKALKDLCACIVRMGDWSFNPEACYHATDVIERRYSGGIFTVYKLAQS